MKTSSRNEYGGNTLKEVNDQKYMLAFIFFMLAGISNSNPHKKSCFLYFLEETELTPSKFDIETYCSNHPEKFIAFINLLNNHSLYQQQFTLAIQNNYLPALFEDIKLGQLYSKALAATGRMEQSNIHRELIKKCLLTLLKKFPDNFNEKDAYNIFYKTVVDFAETHFAATESLNDFDIMVNLARFYVIADIKKGKALLKEISVLKNSGGIENEALYAQLLLTHSTSREATQALNEENKNIDIDALLNNSLLASGKEKALENKFAQQLVTTMKNMISRQLKGILNSTSSIDEITFINQKLKQLATINSPQELDSLINELELNGIDTVAGNINNNSGPSRLG